MNEAQTRKDLIDPAIEKAGWTKANGCQVLVEQSAVEFAPGKVGKVHGKPLAADYVLTYRGRRLVVIEAKRDEVDASLGFDQAIKYGRLLGMTAAYATNGKEIYEMDLQTGGATPVKSFASPQEIWKRAFPNECGWRDTFTNEPFWFCAGKKVRYYQELAVNRVLDAVAEQKTRMLLTLATGTGKTFIAFQIAWKLMRTKWNLESAKNDGVKGTRSPRILFITYRNFLANQGLIDFSGFEEKACVRVTPEAVHKAGDKVPTNASVYFTIIDTFMVGEEGHEFFHQYDPNFFDFVIIDECHSGASNDEGRWRKVLEYFKSAYQLGMTATPKRDVNADTYKYFGKPVFEYSLQQGIEDGFLTPFRVMKAESTIDEYEYCEGDEVVAGEDEFDKDKTYVEKDFYHGRISIRARDEHRVDELMAKIDPMEKAIVFCYNQSHAAHIAAMINARQKIKDKTPDYCRRVTADDGAKGETILKQFQRHDKLFPVILTTSVKLSTGLDARNVRTIVLMRPVNSMVEFKQIVGRGTRLFDNKYYFTIFDFVNASTKFEDPDWDGPPVCPKCGNDPCTCKKPKKGGGGESKPCPVCGNLPCTCPKEDKTIKVKLGEKHAVQVKTDWQTLIMFGGKPISVDEFVKKVYGKISMFIDSAEALRTAWSNPKTRKVLLEKLADEGFDLERLKELQKLVESQDCDLLDVLEYVAFELPRVKRAARADAARETLATWVKNDNQIEFYNFVLDNYVKDGVDVFLAQDGLSKMIKVKYQTIPDAVKALGPIPSIQSGFIELQKNVYAA